MKAREQDIAATVVAWLEDCGHDVYPFSTALIVAWLAPTALASTSWLTFRAFRAARMAAHHSAVTAISGSAWVAGGGGSAVLRTASS